jgi:hypothetical protein|tara:strand:+ start:125 stop:256 length:132 start_codon:yes stop_codon:yes gene_type:complete
MCRKLAKTGMGYDGPQSMARAPSQYENAYQLPAVNATELRLQN